MPFWLSKDHHLQVGIHPYHHKQQQTDQCWIISSSQGPTKTAVQIPRQRKTAILTSTPVKEMIEKVKEKTFEKVKKKLFA
jgi:hypothetical protein